jgi:hypothetical protein
MPSARSAADHRNHIAEDDGIFSLIRNKLKLFRYFTSRKMRGGRTHRARPPPPASVAND